MCWRRLCVDSVIKLWKQPWCLAAVFEDSASIWISPDTLINRLLISGPRSITHLPYICSGDKAVSHLLSFTFFAFSIYQGCNDKVSYADTPHRGQKQPAVISGTNCSPYTEEIPCDYNMFSRVSASALPFYLAQLHIFWTPGFDFLRCPTCWEDKLLVNRLLVRLAGVVFSLFT